MTDWNNSPDAAHWAPDGTHQDEPDVYALMSGMTPSGPAHTAPGDAVNTPHNCPHCHELVRTPTQHTCGRNPAGGLPAHQPHHTPQPGDQPRTTRQRRDR